MNPTDILVLRLCCKRFSISTMSPAPEHDKIKFVQDLLKCFQSSADACPDAPPPLHNIPAHLQWFASRPITGVRELAVPYKMHRIGQSYIQAYVHIREGSAHLASKNSADPSLSLPPSSELHVPHDVVLPALDTNIASEYIFKVRCGFLSDEAKLYKFLSTFHKATDSERAIDPMDTMHNYIRSVMRLKAPFRDPREAMEEGEFTVRILRMAIVYNQFSTNLSLHYIANNCSSGNLRLMWGKPPNACGIPESVSKLGGHGIPLSFSAVDVISNSIPYDNGDEEEGTDLYDIYLYCVYLQRPNGTPCDVRTAVDPESAAMYLTEKSIRYGYDVVLLKHPGCIPMFPVCRVTVEVMY